MAPHSSTLAWNIPWMEEPGRLQSMGSLRVGHDWATSLSLFTSCIGEGNGNPLQCSCLENPRDSGAWWAAIYGVAQSQTWLKRLSSSSSEVKNLKRRGRNKIFMSQRSWFLPKGSKRPRITSFCSKVQSLVCLFSFLKKNKKIKNINCHLKNLEAFKTFSFFPKRLENLARKPLYHCKNKWEDCA